MTVVWNIFSVLHITNLVVMLGFCIYFLFKKHRLSWHRWLLILCLFAINIIQIVYGVTYNQGNVEEDCGFKQKFYFGTIDIIYYTVILDIAYNLRMLTLSIEKFVIKGILPDK